MLGALRRHCESGRPLRILTTTYTGEYYMLFATEERYVELNISEHEVWAGAVTNYNLSEPEKLSEHDELKLGVLINTQSGRNRSGNGFTLGLRQVVVIERIRHLIPTPATAGN